MGKIHGTHLQKIYKALLSGYDDEGDLARMVRFQLDEDLDQVAGGDSLRDIVFSLIEWADNHGRLRELVFGAYEHRPGNNEIKEVAENYDSWLQEQTISHEYSVERTTHQQPRKSVPEIMKMLSETISSW